MKNSQFPITLAWTMQVIFQFAKYSFNIRATKCHSQISKYGLFEESSVTAQCALNWEFLVSNFRMCASFYVLCSRHHLYFIGQIRKEMEKWHSQNPVYFHRETEIVFKTRTIKPGNKEQFTFPLWYFFRLFHHSDWVFLCFFFQKIALWQHIWGAGVCISCHRFAWVISIFNQCNRI